MGIFCVSLSFHNENVTYVRLKKESKDFSPRTHSPHFELSAFV